MTGTATAGTVAVSLRTHALSLAAVPLLCFGALQCRFSTAAHLNGLHDMQMHPKPGPKRAKLELHVLAHTRRLPTCVECWCGCVHYVLVHAGVDLSQKLLCHSLRHVSCVCAVPIDQVRTVRCIRCPGLCRM
jgi:hypothetical protein